MAGYDIERYLDIRNAGAASFGPDGDRLSFLIDTTGTDQVWSLAAPLFVAHGENDPRVPVGEACQIAEGAAAQGVPVEMLFFDDEGHGFAKLENRIEAYSAIAAFLDEHV